MYIDMSVSKSVSREIWMDVINTSTDAWMYACMCA